MSQKICVIGLGYVGLTLATALAETEHEVSGVDSSDKVFASLTEGRPLFFDEGLSGAMEASIRTKNLRFFRSLGEVRQKFEYVIIALGSPVDSTRRTRLDDLYGLAGPIARICDDNSVVILRSTVPVGTSRTLQGHIAKTPSSAQVAYCPERTIEGRAYKELFELPQIVSGATSDAMEKAALLFGSLTKDIVKVSTLEAAELAKLASNLWRDLTFSFANQLYTSTNKLNIDINEVITAANHNYPRNSIPRPGAVGGPCVPKDVYLFSQSIENSDHLFDHARNINRGFPRAVMTRAFQAGILGKRIALLGWAFKGNPPTNDIRDSPTFDYFRAITELSSQSEIFGWDKETIDTSAVPPSVLWEEKLKDVITKCDTLILANDHPFFSEAAFLDALNMKPDIVVIDLWNKLSAHGLRPTAVLGLGSF